MGTGRSSVLLHGFAMTHRYWLPVLDRADAGRAIIAFDLPGHGRSAATPSGRTTEAADRLIAELQRRAIGPVDLVGHSMGGAIAALIALKRPALVSSLTLLAPGGFGPAINAGLLRKFAAAHDVETLRPLLGQFYARPELMPETSLAAVAADHARPGATAEYLRIAETFLRGDEQGVLPLDALAALGIPIRVIWGDCDRITPPEQAHGLPAPFDVHVLAGAGHSIVDEVPDTAAELIFHKS